MANHHFGKFADVWKHLVLDEVLVSLKPARYAETHAGSAAYPMVADPERRYGVTGFLDRLPESSPLRATAFFKVADRFVNGRPAQYPGSALQAMTLLGDACEYLLCDLDPVSASDLRSWAAQLKLSRCEVAQRNGNAAVRQWLNRPERTVVHIDPFDPFRREDGGPSAIEMAAQVAEAGHTLVYWYGFDHPGERAWPVKELRSRTRAPLWCGDFMITTREGAAENGDLGAATSPGTGNGIVLANVPVDLLQRCEELAHALAEHYEGRPLPSGEPGRLDLRVELAR